MQAKWLETSFLSPPVAHHLHRLLVPTLQYRRDFYAERMRRQAHDDANGIAPGTPGASVIDEEGCGVQLDLRSGRGVTEVDWTTLLDGSRVLELLYRLEV